MKAKARGRLLLAAAIAVAAASGAIFQAMHEREAVIPGKGVTRTAMLGDYAPALKGTPADTPVYFLEGTEPGPTLLLFGGTHPQEISGMLSAVLVVENVEVRRGRVIVIPHSNQSGFTYTEPLEAFPHDFGIPTAAGERRFRLGMRLANPVHQWPDPDIYSHYPSGEPLIGSEARNLNRAYPGRADGRYTERVAHAILGLAVREKVDLVLDMHEAYPEYPIINMIVAHERAFETATMTSVALQARGIAMNVMASPKNLHGLTHREFGDHTGAQALLSETSNPGMGRFRGRTDEALIVGGKDVNYVAAAKLKRLFVPFDEAGHPLSLRVARQLATIEEMLLAYNDAHTEKPFEVAGLPPYDDVRKSGIGAFLRAAP
ncbi:MAG: succinylglutamate desuccinylase/aspartoacylase family protein [Betaproteobacteria bacterium]